MRSKVLWFLLAASLALNVFFAAGLIYPRLMGHPDPSDRPDPVASAAEDFALDERQVAALEALRQRLAERRSDSREGESFRVLIIDALRQPAFDRAALAEALAQRRATAGDMILDMAEDLHGFLAGLTPDQKAAFLQRARDRHFLRRLLFPPVRADGEVSNR